MQAGFFDSSINVIEQINFDRNEDHLNLFLQSASDQLVIPNHVVDREWNILLCLERDDFLQLFLFKAGQFNKAGKNRLRG
jgi:hypothetical protein